MLIIEDSGKRVWTNIDNSFNLQSNPSGFFHSVIYSFFPKFLLENVEYCSYDQQKQTMQLKTEYYSAQSIKINLELRQKVTGTNRWSIKSSAEGTAACKGKITLFNSW